MRNKTSLPGFALAFAAAATLAAVGLAQVKPGAGARLTFEDVLRWQIASNPVLSPDGRRAAYLVTESDFQASRWVTHLWWVDTTTRQTRRLTQADDGAADPRWSPDGRWLAFRSARGPDAEAKRAAQVWLLPVEGGESFALTRAPEGVLHYRWALDSKAIYYVAREPRPAPAAALREQQQKQKIDAVIVGEEKFRKEIWRTTLEGRKAERIFAGDLGLDSIEPSPDGKWVVYRTNYTGESDHSRKFDLWVLDLTTRRARQLTRRDGEERAPAWSPDSAQVAFLAPRVPEIPYSQEEVFAVPVAPTAEPPEPRRLTQDFSGAIERLHWPGNGEAIYFAAAVHSGNRLYALTLADGAVQPASPEGTFLTDADWTGDGAACAALLESPAALPEVVVLRPAAALVEPQQLTEMSAQLKNFALGAQEVIRWKAKDGLEIEGVLVKPPGWVATEKYPLLLDIHGGPHSRRANTLTSGNFPQVWAARGWLVLQPNFRGSSAYGHEFGVASRGDIGGKDYEDILLGLDFVLAQGWADPNRMAVMGGSYGGYMTNLLIARTKRFQVAASFYGIFSLITDYSNSDFSSWEPDYLTKYYWEDLQLYLDRSPMKRVTEITTPVLILHGEQDNNTFVANSLEMYTALKALGRKVKFVRFPREGHGFREPNHLLEQFRQIAAWFDQHVPGAAPERARVESEAVRAGAWELKVAAVSLPESYAGVKPKGRFVEVTVLIRAADPTEERFSVLLFDNVGSEIVLAAPDRAVYPEGLVAESLGQRILAKSSSQVVAFVPDRDGNHAAMALSVAFDAPVDARQFTLKVKDFPPIRIELPAEAKTAR